MNHALRCSLLHPCLRSHTHRKLSHTDVNCEALIRLRGMMLPVGEQTVYDMMQFGHPNCQNVCMCEINRSDACL
jgi:hypothetical protein